MKKQLQGLDLGFFARLSLTGIALLALLEASLVAMVGEFFFEGIWPGLFLFWYALSWPLAFFIFMRFNCHVRLTELSTELWITWRV